MSSLARFYWDKGDYAAAEPLYKRALAGREQTLGADHPDTVTGVNELARLYWAKGDYKAAEPLFKRALAGKEMTLGPDHPETLKSVNSLASLYRRMKRLDLSIPLIEDAVKRTRAKLGDGHPTTLLAVANLGINYRDAGRLDEAIPLLEEAYRAAGKSPELSWVGNELVGAYTKAGKRREAGDLLRGQLTAARKQRPPQSAELGGQLAASGKMLLELGAFADAESLLREGLTIREKMTSMAWGTANTNSLLGEALLGQKKHAEAEPLLVASYKGLKVNAGAIPPEGKTNLSDALDRLIDLYAAMNKPEEARKWQTERAKYPQVAPPPREKK